MGPSRIKKEIEHAEYMNSAQSHLDDYADLKNRFEIEKRSFDRKSSI